MQLKPDCIPCILTMSVGAIRKLGLDDTEAKNLYTDILKIFGLRGLEWNRTSPAVVEVIMKKISAAVNNPDPFQEEKIDLNRRVLKIYPFLEKLVKDSPDPLNTAVKVSILGNSIDFMMPEGISTLEDFIINKLETTISEQGFAAFRRQLPKTKRILIFGDNCGEIIFDKLLIKTIKEHYNIDFTYVVRCLPTMNDATLREAYDMGLDEVATIIDNGIDGPLPGTVLKRCSSQVNKWVRTSDLIIAKGTGNFDSLEEELSFFKANQLKITFMLLSKCHPISSYFKVDRHTPIIANFFWNKD
ncbi:MAG: ARMT1-like domain-containing protein [Desulfobacterales bacterium]|nr:ARMT1-like domain-containing protein [Desulfobacterales bacterium]